MDVAYAFEPGAGRVRGGTVQGHAYLAGTDFAGDPRYRYAVDTNTVPVVYDPLQPSRSRLNFDDSVYRQNPSAAARILFLLWAAVMTLIFAVTAGITWVSFGVLARRRLGRGGGPTRLTSSSS